MLPLFEGRIRIRSHIKVKGRIRIRIKVASRIRIRINVMQIHNTVISCFHSGLFLLLFPIALTRKFDCLGLIAPYRFHNYQFKLANL